ncbi:MAG: hypothetical protein IJV27_12330 [Prevotella sp.]|nr:hypothetical protein [Prevotella sp.]
MKKSFLSRLSFRLFSGVMVLLGLGSCATTKNATKREQARQEKRRGQEQQQMIDEQQRMEQDPGRMICLYGGPNMRYREVEQLPQTDIPESSEQK